MSDPTEDEQIFRDAMRELNEVDFVMDDESGERFSDLIRRLWAEEYEKVLLGEGGAAFTGLRNLPAPSEHNFWPWHVSERPESFTPAEFEKLWNKFSRERKVQYVLSLILE